MRTRWMRQRGQERNLPSGDQRIRLLKFVALFGCGGTERQVVNLSAALDRDRFDLRLACMRRWGHFLGEIEGRGMPVREYRFPRFVSPQCGIQGLRLARNLIRHRVQIVHSYNFYANVFALPAARLARVPVVIASIRDQGIYLTDRQRAVHRAVCRLADCILVNAGSIKTWLASEGCDTRKVVIIRNGIDVSRFPAHGDGSQLRQELGLPADTLIVASVSRLSRAKGLEDLLEAISLLAVRHPNLRLVIVGESLTTRQGKVVPDDEYLTGLRERARQLGLGGRVIFTGYRSDIPSLLSQVTIAVQPSLSEGLSNTVLESMAAGAPLVATDVGGTSEVVTDGRTGLLVPPQDPPSLARAIGRLLDAPEIASQLGRAGRQFIEANLSMPRMVEATERLYVDLLARRLAAHRRIGFLVRPSVIDVLEGRQP